MCNQLQPLCHRKEQLGIPEKQGLPGWLKAGIRMHPVTITASFSWALGALDVRSAGPGTSHACLVQGSTPAKRFAPPMRPNHRRRRRHGPRSFT